MTVILYKDKLIDKLKTYLTAQQLERVEQACRLMVDAHGEQLRKSGDPYYSHPLEVACILADMKLDVATIITALLHDTVEDTDLSLLEIEKKFGSEISKLVDGITKLTKIEHQSEHTRQAENFRKLLLAMSEDIRVLLIKLADRLHNMRTLQYISSHEKRIKTAHETMEIYAPLAERIGIQTFKSELQDLAFAELYTEARTSIINRLEFLRREGDIVVDKIVIHIQEILTKVGIKANVSGREKAPYSIWQKMERKSVGFEQLSDIMAFRILVDDVQECYRALGVIHSTYHMVPDSFKDFISTPKDNGYQSIHTVVIGPELQRIEVQIRTYDMHQIAELGVAAHWSYKQNYQYNIDGKQFRWIRELLDILEHAVDSDEFLENTKMEMYYDQVFCFTPKGNLIALPKGASPIDFAYAVHSDVGHTCVGAKVNGRIVPLRTHLRNGDQVEIIRSKTQVPSSAWENFVVTGKARSEIRRFVRAQQRHEYINLGRAMLNKLFRSAGQEFNDKVLESCLEHFKKKTTDDLIMAVGEGILNRNDILKFIAPADPEESSIKKKFSSLLKFRKKQQSSTKTKEHSIPIKGMIQGMAIHFAGCCHPLPGDTIVGIVHTGKGITIHTVDCPVLENFSANPERWVDVSWEKDTHDEIHIGRIKAIVSHEPGSLAAITNVIAKDRSNITNLKIVNRTSDFFEVIIDVEVKGATQLEHMIASLRSKDPIHSVERYKI